MQYLTFLRIKISGGWRFLGANGKAEWGPDMPSLLDNLELAFMDPSKP